MMKTTARPSDIRRAIEREARELDRWQRLLGKQVAQLYKSFSRDLKAFLNDPEGFSRRSKVGLAQTIKVIDQLNSILREAGLGELKAAQREAYSALADMTVSKFVDMGAQLKYADLNVQSLDAYVRFSESQLDRLIDQRLIAPAQTVLFQSSIGNQPASSIIPAVLNAIDGLNTRAVENALNFTMEAFQRQVTVETGEALGLEIYQYIGPLDAITSPQCEAMLTIDLHGVPGMLYKDEITPDLHPDLVYPPLIAGGHPNCRHQWVPVSLEYAVAQGFKV